MSLITRMRKQTAVYWAPIGYDNTGHPEWDDPIEIDCRWEDVTEEFIDPTGTRFFSTAKVYVDQDVELGGVLMLGELDDLESGSDPKANEGAWEIKRFEKLPNLRNTENLRTALLGVFGAG
jgi:hypothetical protein